MSVPRAPAAGSTGPGGTPATPAMADTWFAAGDSFTTGVGDDPAAGGWVARTAAVGPATKLSWRVDRLNARVRAEEAAAGFGRRPGGNLVVLDTNAVLRDRTLWDDDGVHPGPAGHEALAAAALDVLRRPLAAAAT